MQIHSIIFYLIYASGFPLGHMAPLPGKAGPELDSRQ